MGQVLHGSATTTQAVRAAIQRSQASIAELSRELGINPKTVSKWRKRQTVEDQKTGPKEPRSTVLSDEEEAMVVAFRRHTFLPLDDCLYALQPLIPHLTRSSLHRCLQRHGISRLPDVAGDKPKRQKFKRYPIGYFHIDIAEVRTGEGKLHLFVGIDVHPNQIKQWKDQLLDGVTDVFDDKPKASKAPEIDVKSFHAKVGQLTLENDFLGEALAKAGLLGSAKK